MQETVQSGGDGGPGGSSVLPSWQAKGRAGVQGSGVPLEQLISHWLMRHCGDPQHQKGSPHPRLDGVSDVHEA